MKTAYEQRLAVHVQAVEVGLRQTDFEMRDFLRELLQVADDANDAPPGQVDGTGDQLSNRQHLIVDIVAGRYGQAAMMEAILTFEGDFDRSGLDTDFITTTLAVGRAAMVESGLLGTSSSPSEFRPLDVAAVMTGLLKARAPWADATTVDLLAGRFGTALRRQATMAVSEGFDVDGNGSRLSLLRSCVATGRLELLREVASLDFSPELERWAEKQYTNATTSGGRWLDLLANIGDRPRTSFARQVDAFRSSPLSTLLAEILVKRDPNHKSIDVEKGHPGYAIIMEALMRHRISSEPSPAVGVAAEGAGDIRRHRRMGL